MKQKWLAHLKGPPLQPHTAWGDGLEGALLCNPASDAHLASTVPPVLQRVTDQAKDSLTSQRCHSTDATRNGRCDTTCTTLGKDVRHTHSNTTAVTAEHHSPELSLLNMVQIIGYANMHNAVSKHLLCTQALLHATHSVTRVGKMLS